MSDEQEHEDQVSAEDSEEYWLRWVPDTARGFLPSRYEKVQAGAGDWRRHVPEQWRHLLESSPAPRPQSRSLRFIGVDEDQPGERWQALFEETWPAYRSWWFGSGADARPTRRVAEEALREHMPELIPIHEHLGDLAGNEDAVSAMLALWNPPPFIVACSQAVVPDSHSGEPVLIRNYDYDPHLFEASVYRSRWSSRRVIGTGDCLWGLVDGLNDSGLAVSLTFGGRREIGEGFGVPLVIRYLLESSDDVPAAVEALRRLPHQLSYNITLCDRTGAVATVFVAPDRPARVTNQRQTTNHPEVVEWPEHASWVRSIERLELLEQLQQNGIHSEELVARMVAPPLLARQWDAGFATLYTAAYRPAAGTLTYHWPDQTATLPINQPTPAYFEVRLDEEQPSDRVY